MEVVLILCKLRCAVPRPTRFFFFFFLPWVSSLVLHKLLVYSNGGGGYMPGLNWLQLPVGQEHVFYVWQMGADIGGWSVNNNTQHE